MRVFLKPLACLPRWCGSAPFGACSCSCSRSRPVRVGRRRLTPSGLQSIKQSHQESVNCDLHSALPMNPQTAPSFFCTQTKEKEEKKTQRGREERKKNRKMKMNICHRDEGRNNLMSALTFILFLYLFLYLFFIFQSVFSFRVLSVRLKFDTRVRATELQRRGQR